MLIQLRTSAFIIFISLCCLSTVSLNAQNNKVDSLMVVLKNTNNVDKKAALNISLARLKLHREPKNALSHLDSARALCNKIKNDTLLFNVYFNYVNYYFLKQKHNKTFAYIDSALIHKNTVAPKRVVRLHTVLAQNSNFIGDQDQAITAYKTALEICNENQLNTSKSGVYNGLGTMYLNKKDFTQAEDNAKQSIVWSEKSQSQRNAAHGHLNLGKIYFEQGKTDNALEAFKLVQAHLDSVPNLILSHGLNTNLGRLYRDTKEYDKAINHFKNNLEIDKKIKNDIGINTSRTDIAQTLFLQKKYNQAIYVLEENLTDAKAIDNPKMIQQNLLDLAIVYEGKQSYKQALDYRKQFETWQDSIVSTENLNAIAVLELKYETEKKENEILQLSQQRLADSMAIKEQSLWIRRLLYGILGLFVCFIAVFIIVRQRNKYRKQRALIHAITETQIAEQQRISQDLHDSIGGSLAFVKTQLSDLNKTQAQPETIDKILKTVTKTSEEVRQISHNLMPGELVKFGLKPAIESLLNTVQSETLETNLYTHDVDERMDSKKEVHLFRIVQELVQNVMKHAKANVLNVYLNKRDKNLSLIIEDNGIGFDTKSTTANIGIGFKTIANRVNYLNGELKIDSHKDQGSSFNILIPLG